MSTEHDAVLQCPSINRFNFLNMSPLSTSYILHTYEIESSSRDHTFVYLFCHLLELSLVDDGGSVILLLTSYLYYVKIAKLDRII
jgi:hypothetical protein